MTESELNALKLTPAMKTWLLDLAEGRDPGARLRGRSAHGGAEGTRFALIRRGLIDMSGLTDLGRQAASLLADGRSR